jgi:hypothetical protein
MPERVRDIAVGVMTHVSRLCKVSLVRPLSLRSLPPPSVLSDAPEAVREALVGKLGAGVLPTLLLQEVVHKGTRIPEEVVAARQAAARTMSVDKLLANIHVFRACDLTDQQAIVHHLPEFLTAHPQVGGAALHPFPPSPPPPRILPLPFLSGGLAIVVQVLFRVSTVVELIAMASRRGCRPAIAVTPCVGAAGGCGQHGVPLQARH